MESTLEKIATTMENVERNTDPKSSFYILVSEKSSKFRTRYNPLIDLDVRKKYEMALVNLETFYSFPNISATNNNFRYSPDDGDTWVDIDIPEGCYEIADINEYLQRIMREKGHYDATKEECCITLQPNTNTLKSVLTIATDYKVDLTPINSIRSVLGFKRYVYSEGYNESEDMVNIMNVTSLRVTSDIIGASYTNGTTGNVIYSFFPNVGPGYKIIEVPTNLIYLPVTLSTISSMETRFTDQDGTLINLRGEELSIRFHLREV